MEEQELVLQNEDRLFPLKLRDFIATGFRCQRALLLCFVGILLTSILAGALWPKYRAETLILLRRQRVDPMVTPDQNSQMMAGGGVTEEEINSEVELVRTEDVLRKVVLRCQLDKRHSLLKSLFGSSDPERRTAKAVQDLRAGLSIDSLPKTNMIRVTYTSSNPQLAAQVLKVLDDVYLEKHEQIQRTAGQFEFFEQEAARAKAELNSGEERLKSFPRTIGTANPGLGRDITLQKLNDFQSSLAQTQAAIAEITKKTTALEQLSKTTSSRLTTQMRRQDDAPVLQQMKSTLLNLELKRSDLASKYQPGYPPLQELDLEIAQTRAAISDEKPLSDITTDQNPAYTWISTELVKLKAELRGYEARASQTEHSIREATENAQKLDAQSVEQQDLARSAKSAEENYLLYLRKREEARIADAFDAHGILNIAIAEKPSVPSLPSESLWKYALIGSLLAVTVSAGAVFTFEYFDPYFRSSAEVEAVLKCTVLAAVPNYSSGFLMRNLSGQDGEIQSPQRS